MILLIPIFIYLMWINLTTYRAFAADKRFAINDMQRTPEKTLLGLAFRGGWVGAKIAQRKLRHKTLKQPFGHHLNIIGMVHASSAVLFLFVMTALAFAPEREIIILTASAAPAAAANDQHAGARLLISLRPPAARPATW